MNKKLENITTYWYGRVGSMRKEVIKSNVIIKKERAKVQK